MAYRSTQACVDDLLQTKQLVVVEEPVDARLEMAAIQRRVFAAGGPAMLFTNPIGSAFPMVSNLFGTIERARYLFRDTLSEVEQLIKLKIDPAAALRKPFRQLRAAPAALAMRPKYVRTGPILENQTTIDKLPKLVSWPEDGGAFITLPQVYTEDPVAPGWKRSNLGMYRVQLDGGAYTLNKEIGLHYQIHRGIGVHHEAALKMGQPLRVQIFIGGSPAMTLAAVMPLPEGMSELMFAGALSKRRVRLIARPDGSVLHAEADFCITGTLHPSKQLPEGPFGDHLGYYSLAHDFPVLQVEKVYHRTGAIWLFTVVGRPPQEDTIFGQLIHEITGPIIPNVLPGVRTIHAVDACGVHPLLLAIGSERYTPYSGETRPQELLTQANAIMGQGQLSLAKYLFIVNQADHPTLDVNDIEAFLQHVFERADWRRDLHFQTETTIDTLDYTGTGINKGSKLVVAAAGPARFELPKTKPAELRLPTMCEAASVALPGVLAMKIRAGARLTELDLDSDAWNWGGFRLIVVVDDVDFSTQSLANFLWVTFTRSNPATDINGVGAFTQAKHWGCRGPLVLDARIKPHHAPPLVEDPATVKRIEKLAAPGGPLHGLY